MNLYTRGRHKGKEQCNAQNKYTSTQKGSTKQFEKVDTWWSQRSQIENLKKQEILKE